MRRWFKGYEQLEERRLLTGDVSGRVFVDLDGDGEFQVAANEFGLGDFLVHVDKNRDGVFTQESNEFSTSTMLPLVIPDNGLRSASVDVDLPGHFVVDVNVSLTVDNFFTDLVTVQLRSPSGDLLTLYRGEIDVENLILDDEALNEFIFDEGRDISGTLQPQNSLSLFDGTEADGRWTLSVRQTDGFSEVELEALTLTITTTEEKFALTAEDGTYELDGLQAGAFPIIATTPNAWAVPRAKYTSDVIIVDDSEVRLDVPTSPEPLSLSGRIWQDANANGVGDEGERGLAGWIVYADENGNGELDAGEIQATTLADDPATADTDESGNYVFDDIPAGAYDVRTIAPVGWNSYAVVNENTRSERYVIHEREKFSRLRDNDTRSNLATLSRSSIADFDYSTSEEVFYGILEDQLVAFELENSFVQRIGEFDGDRSDEFPFEPAGISVINDQILIAAGSLLVVDPETGAAEPLYDWTEEDPFISLIDTSVDGMLYGLVVSERTFERDLVELDPSSGQVVRTLAEQLPGNFVGMDVLPNGEIILATFEQNFYFDASGVLLRRTSPPLATFDWTTGIASVPETEWNDIRVNLESIPAKVDFGAYQPSVIRGRLMVSDGETMTGLGGQRMYLDVNENGDFDFGEPFAFTKTVDETTTEEEVGSYEFLDVPPGDYTIRQVLASDLDQQSPSDGIFVRVDDGVASVDNDFVNVAGQMFSGMVYLDANGNGAQDAAEEGLEGVTGLSGPQRQRSFGRGRTNDCHGKRRRGLGRWKF